MRNTENKAAFTGTDHTSTNLGRTNSPIEVCKMANNPGGTDAASRDVLNGVARDELFGSPSEYATATHDPE
jgi:hypothetical protein